jgi:hypothetical protein
LHTCALTYRSFYVLPLVPRHILSLFYFVKIMPKFTVKSHQKVPLEGQSPDQRQTLYLLHCCCGVAYCARRDQDIILALLRYMLKGVQISHMEGSHVDQEVNEVNSPMQRVRPLDPSQRDGATHARLQTRSTFKSVMKPSLISSYGLG